MASMSSSKSGGAGVRVASPSNFPRKGTCSAAARGPASPRAATTASTRPPAKRKRFMGSLPVCDGMERHRCRRADRAPGRCRAGGGLLGGKDPAGRLSILRHGFPALLLPCNDRASANTESAEHVVVARGSVIGEDDRQPVGARDPARREVETATLAEAGGASLTGSAAVGPVERDKAA